MRSLHILSFVFAVSAFNFPPDIFQQKQQQECTVYTVIQYPCAVETCVTSNTVLWVDACQTTLNITYAPTSVTTTLTSTTTVGITSTSTSTTTVIVSLQTTATQSTTLPGPAQSTQVILTSPGANPTSPIVNPTNPGVNPTSPDTNLLSSTLPPVAGPVLSTMEYASMSSNLPPVASPVLSTMEDALMSSNILPVASPVLSMMEDASTGVTPIPSPASSVSPMLSSASSGCVPSSTAYPDAEHIPANTTYIIQVTSPQIQSQLNGVPVYLTKNGGINYAANLAVEIFFYDGILVALDSVSGVGWYVTSQTTGESTFELTQYSKNSQEIAKTFTTMGTSPLVLAWDNCLFGNPTVVWALNVVDGLVHTWFSGTPGPPSDVEIVTLVLTTSPTATATPTATSSVPSEASPTGIMASPTCIPPSTTGYAPGNNIPANTTYVLQLYYSLSPGVLTPYGGNVYLKREGTYTAANSYVDAIQAFFVDGTLVAAHPIFIYGWFTTTSPAVDAPFALGEYLPQAELTARQFSMSPTSPPSLVWENCEFEGGEASFVLDQDTSCVYSVFDGMMNQGANHIPIWLIPTIYN